MPIALSVALGGRQNRTVTRAKNDFFLQNWNFYRTYRCICWCQCFLCTFCSSRLIACYLRSSCNRPRVVAAALMSQIQVREFSLKKNLLLWANRKIFVLCQQCFPSYQLASSLPATKSVNWSVLHPVCASFKSILVILKLIFQVKWNKGAKLRRTYFFTQHC